MIIKHVNWEASGKNINNSQYVSNIARYVDQNLVIQSN
jgi:hypothetical protein